MGLKCVALGHDWEINATSAQTQMVCKCCGKTRVKIHGSEGKEKWEDQKDNKPKK